MSRLTKKLVNKIKEVPNCWNSLSELIKVLQKIEQECKTFSNVDMVLETYGYDPAHLELQYTRLETDKELAVRQVNVDKALERKIKFDRRHKKENIKRLTVMREAHVKAIKKLEDKINT